MECLVKFLMLFHILRQLDGKVSYLREPFGGVWETRGLGSG